MGSKRSSDVRLTVVDGVDRPRSQKRAQKLCENIKGQHLPPKAAECAHGE